MKVGIVVLNYNGWKDTLECIESLKRCRKNFKEIEKIVVFKNIFKRSQVDGIVSPKIYFAPGFEFHKDKYPKTDLGKVIWYAGGRIDWSNIIGMHVGVDEVDIGQFNEK